MLKCIIVETYITNKYQFIIDKNHFTADLFPLTENSFKLNKPLLPNDVSILLLSLLHLHRIKSLYTLISNTELTLKNFMNLKIILMQK